MRESRPIAVVANWRDLHHHRAGGAEMVCDRLADHLASQGHRVVHLAAAVPGRARREARGGYEIARGGGELTVYLWALAWMLVHRRRISLVIDSQNGIPFFSPLVLRRRTPALLLLHHVHQDQFALYFSPAMARFGRFLEGPVSRLVYGTRRLLAVSFSTRDGAHEILGLRGPVTVVPPGWEVTKDLRHGLPDKTAHPSLVVVGRLVPHKRPDLVLRALAHLRVEVPDLTLDVVGGGPMLPDLEQLADQLGVRDAVTFRPHCPDVERDEVVARSWLCVNASVGEGWGISVIEANALGTPVLAFDRPGLRDSVKNGVSGWLVPEGEDLAGAALPLLADLRDPVTQARTARDCHRWAGHFTWDAMGVKVLAAIRTEAERLSPRPPAVDELRPRADSSPPGPDQLAG